MMRAADQRRSSYLARRANARARASAGRGQRHLPDRGLLVDGVAPRLGRLRTDLDVQTTDTLGTVDDIAAALGVGARRVSDGFEKRDPR